MIEQESDPRIGKILEAISKEKSENPACPQASQIAEALSMGDIDFAYEMALDTLTPKKSIFTSLMEHFSKSKKS